MKIFSKVPVEIPNRSGHDLSHSNMLTHPVGTLVPILVDPLLPNDTVSLGAVASVQLPPMATDFMGRVRYKIEAFFVPYRILWGGWQQWFTNFGGQSNGSSGFAAPSLPSIKFKLSSFDDNSSTAADLYNAAFGPGSLADYLGYKCPAYTPSVTQLDFKMVNVINTITFKNIFPFLAYHKIYNDWYRNSLIQREVFTPNLNTSSSGVPGRGISTVPYNTYCADAASNDFVFPTLLDFATKPGDTGTVSGPNPFMFADSGRLGNLRQRNFSKDYFTNATSLPQSGQPVSLSFSTESDSGSFTIAGLRAANSLQQFKERMNIAGGRYADQIKAQYGIYPADAVTDRAIYLGSMSFDVYNKRVYQSQNDTDTSPDTNNPFGSTGSSYASPQGFGSGSLVGKFTASEHGLLFVIGSLVPDAVYSTGSRRYLNDVDADLVAPPILQNVGDQPVMQTEVVNFAPAATYGTDINGVFGYTQRFSQFKFMLDEVHGLLRDGSSLDSFSLQRGFITPTTVNTSFLQIPTTYLDQVSAVDSTKTSQYGCWCDFGFNYRKVSTLAAYSIPTLGDLKNTHTEVVDKNGKML